MKSYYDILGVDKSASKDEIKKAYKSLAMKYHPDRNPGDKEAEEKFKEISNAYDTLKDDTKRQQYDMGGQNPFGNGFSRGGFGFSQSGRMHDPFDIDDILNSFGFASHRSPRRDVTIEYGITLEECLTGKEAVIKYTLPNGQEKTAKFNVPPGVTNGNRFKLSGMGYSSDSRMAPGDAIVVIRVLPHKTFKREGHHLVYELSLDVLDAICGTDVEVECLDKSKVKVTIPSKTSPDTVLRVPGKGLPNLRRQNSFGDLYIKVSVNMDQITDSDIEKIKELRQN